MSVLSSNMFALLGDGDESDQVAPQKTTAVADAPAAVRGNRGRTPVNTSTSRSGRYPRRGGAPVAQEPEAFAAGNPNEAGVRFDRTENKSDRGRGGRGRGGGRGGRGRGAREGAPAYGRAYDKHSQTGVVDTDKKTEQGWGAETGVAELNAETDGAADATNEWAAPATGDATAWDAPAADATAWDAPAGDAAKSSWDAPAADANGNAAPAQGNGDYKPRRDEEEEDNSITLAEYLAKSKLADSNLPKLDNERKINEAGEWKDAVQLLRDESDEVFFAGKTKTAPKPRARKEEKVIIEIEGRYERPQRDAPRGRGGRGGPRGGDRDRGRGGGRGRGNGHANGNGNGYGRADKNQAAVQLDDKSAFPSLS